MSYFGNLGRTSFFGGFLSSAVGTYNQVADFGAGFSKNYEDYMFGASPKGKKRKKSEDPFSAWTA